MARTALATQEVTTSGLTATLSAANALGHEVSPSILLVHNGSGSSINVTLVTPGSQDGNPVADKVVAVGAGADKYIKIGGTAYAKANGKVDVDFSAVTSVTVASLVD